MTALFHPEALEDLDAAVTWYERARPGLGARFYDAVLAVLDRAERHPASGSPLHAADDPGSDDRIFVVPRFPFVVVVGRAGDAWHVLAVAHTSREPTYWRTRRP